MSDMTPWLCLSVGPLAEGRAVHQVLPPRSSQWTLGSEQGPLGSPPGLYSLAELAQLVATTAPTCPAESSHKHLPACRPPPVRALKNIPQLKSLCSLNPTAAPLRG